MLHDADPQRLAVISAVLAGRAGSARSRLAGSVTEAVTGADVVFSAIRVGGAAGRVRDERRALDLGVLGQETVGAGGIAYALRTLPVALDAAQVIRDVAPDAWLINFTNPAGLVTEALRTVLGDRVIGICDSPIGLVRRAGPRGGTACRPRAARSITSASITSVGCAPCATATEICCRACCPTTRTAILRGGQAFRRAVAPRAGLPAQRVCLLLLRGK